MIVELVIFLCSAGFGAASHINHGHSSVYSTTASPLDVSSATYNNIPIEAKVLQRLLNANSRNSYPVQEQVQYQSVTNAASPGITYSISPAVVKNLPVENKVTVEAQQHVTAHPPTAVYKSNQPQQPVYQNIQTVSHPHVVPLVRAQPVVPVPANIRPATIVTSSRQPIQHVQTVAQGPVFQYAPYAYGVQHQAVNTVSAVPVQANKVSIERHQSVTVHPPTAPRLVHHHVQNVNPPAVQIVSSSVAQNLPSPIQAASGIHDTVTIYPPPASYVTSTLPPQLVQQVRTFVKPKIVNIEAHRSVTVHPPTISQAPVRTVVNRPSVQYVSYQARYPVSTVVSQGAATVIQHGSSNVHHAKSVPAKPIPVPVIYTAEEAPNAKYVTVNTNVQPFSNVVHYSPVAVSQPIPVPVAYPTNNGYVNYSQRIPTPLAYTKSLVQKDHVSADSVSRHIVANYGGYARALTYSPASQVSSVSFNGLGVSYGW